MLRFTLLGLGVGAVYGLSALGVVAIYRGSRVLNMAHGAIAAWSAYLFVELRDHHEVPALASGAIVLVFAALFGVVMYLVVIRPLRARTPVTKLVATVGVLVFLQALALEVYGSETVVPDTSLPSNRIEIFGALVGVDRLILIGIAFLVTVALGVWSSRSQLALATRAMVDHERGAVSLGYSPHVVGAFNWAVGCVLVGLAGILVAPIVGLGPTSMTILLVPSLVAALVGKFDSYWLALAGGLLLGVSESLIARYVKVEGWSGAAPLVLLVVVLLLQRERSLNRLPVQIAIPVSPGLFRWKPAVLGLGGLCAFLLLSDGNIWYDAAIVSMTSAILGLSLVVILGYANQISLAQMAIAGISAFTAARISSELHLPFVVMPVVGAAAGCLVGLVLGVPALRVRGANLAVVTLAFGVAAERVLFRNGRYTGFTEGIKVDSPTIFGIDVDTVRHPQRYAFVVLVWLVVAVAAVLWLRRSVLGRRLIAARTNERASQAAGVDVRRAKIAAFAISSSLAGVAGVLLAFRHTAVVFENGYSSFDSLNLLTVVVVAGVGSIGGGLGAGLIAAGGIVYRFLVEIGVPIGNNYFMVSGLGLVISLMRNPQGLFARRVPPKDPQTIAPGEVETAEPLPLDAEGVTVRFGGVSAVQEVSVHVPVGSVVGVVGPNGAGKTTFLDAVGGFVPTQGGRVALGTHDLSRAPAHRRARQGVARVFQGAELFEDLTVAQNLLVAAETAGKTNGTLPVIASRAVDQFDLAPVLDRRPGDLSLGQRRLVAIARALAINPAVLLLDEPGAGLAVSEMKVLAESIRALGRDGLGILLIDHDMSLVLSVCDRIVVLVQGAVIADGTPDEIVNDPGVRAAYLGESIVVTPRVLEDRPAEPLESASGPLSTGEPVA